MSKVNRSLFIFRGAIVDDTQSVNNISNILLHIKFPIAIVLALFLIADIDTAISGKLVHSHTINIPIKDWLILNLLLSKSALSTVRFEQNIIMVNPHSSDIIDHVNCIFGAVLIFSYNFSSLYKDKK